MTWLQLADDPSVTATADASDPSAGHDVSTEFVEGGLAIRETAFRLDVGNGVQLPAIITEPAQAVDDPLCAVMLSSGSLSSVGPNRIWVQAARRWAADGVTTVRVDFRGIGDAPGDARSPR